MIDDDDFEHEDLRLIFKRYHKPIREALKTRENAEKMELCEARIQALQDIIKSIHDLSGHLRTSRDPNDILDWIHRVSSPITFRNS